jgi:hypothetical protein
VRVVPVLGDLGVDHQLLGPLDRAGADQEQRDPQAEPDRHVVRVAGERPELEDGVARDGEVRDAGTQREQPGQAEHRRDLALDPVGGLRVDVGDAEFVRLDTRVRDRLRQHHLAVVTLLRLHSGQVLLLVTHLPSPPWP